MLATVALEYKQTEFELEQDEELTFDLFKTWQNILHLRTQYGYEDGHSFHLGINLVAEGKIGRQFDQQTPIQAYSIRQKGIHSIQLGWLKNFIVENPDRLSSLSFEIVGNPQAASDKNAALGGADLIARYLFTFLNSWGEIFGDLKMEYRGDKRIRRGDGEEMKIRHLSSIGPSAGYKYRYESFYAFGLLGFQLNTGYQATSPSYNRTTDHGFATQVKLGVGYQRPKWMLELDAIVVTELYNKDAADFANLDNVEFEFETPYNFNLTYSWLF